MLLAAVLLAALGALSLFVARAEADVPLTGSNLPLLGSNHQGGDGNQDDAAPFQDWQHLDAIGALNHYADPNPSDSTFQSGNSAKVGDPYLWDFTTQNNGSSPGNVNIFDAYSSVQTGGDTFLHVAFTRQATSGTAYIGFELNQVAELWNNGIENIPCRTEGDVVVTVQVNGNSTAMLLEEWHTFTTDPGTGCARTGELEPHDTVIDNVDAQGAVNAGTITNYLDESGPLPTSSISAQKFAEASVNLTSVLDNALGRPCFSFGSIWMHTRSSTTPTSDMKDYIAPSPLLVRSCAASGTKFHDLDADGTKDAGEPGLAGFRMFADFDDDGIRQDDEPFDDTAANGDYTIAVKPLNADNTYRIREQLTPPSNGTGGWTCSAPTGAADPVDGIASFTNGNGPGFTCGWGEISLVTNPTVNGKDFGNYKKGKVVVKKVNVGGAQSDAFPFTTQNLGGPFDLAATDAAGRQVTDVVPNVKPGAPTYSVTEGTGAPADRYTLTALDCDDTDSTQNASQATLDTRTATVTVSSGETVTCTFTNTRKTGKLELVKQLEPAADTGKFDLLIDGAPEATAVGDDGTTGEKALPTGSHTVAEAGANGTDLSDYATTLVCKDGNGAGAVVPSPGGAVDVTAGSDIVCTITNKRKATMKVVKQVLNPAGAVDAQKAFAFKPDSSSFLEGAETLADGFVLNDGEARGPKGTFEFGSSFGVTETPDPDYATTSACAGDLTGGTSSTGVGNVLTFAPDPGENLVCTVTNTRKTGKLEVVKDLYPVGDDGLFDLEIDRSAPNAGSVDVGDGGTTGEILLPSGSHHVSESAGAGTSLGDYAKDISCRDGNGSGDAVAGTAGAGPLTIDVTPGSDIVCTITNKRKATMKVVKQVLNPAGAVDAQKAFEFTPDDALFLEGAEVDVFSLKDGESRGPKPTFAFGTGFAVTETANPEYTTTSSCTGDLPGGGDSSGDGSTVTFEPDPGENLVCTVVNTRKTGTVEVRKELEGEGLFDLQIDGATESGADGVGDGGTTGPKLVETGSHEVNELGHGVDLADYVVSTTCADDGHPIETTGSGKGAAGAVTVDVQPGHAVVCVITNVERATVTIVKEVVGGDDDELFEFTPNAALTGASEPDPALVAGKFELEHDGSQRFGRVVPDDGGSYKVTETAEAGYRLTAIECDDDDSTDESSVDGLSPLTATIHVDAGEDVTCTFTNTRNAAIEIEKVNVGGAPADEFEFDPSSDLGVESIALDQDGNWTMTGGDEQVFGDVVPNAGRSAYTVAELVPSGYRLTGIECDHGNTSKTSAAGFDGEAATATIEVEPGQTVHCTFTNTRNGSLTVVKRVEGDPQGQTFAFSPSDDLVTVGGEDPALQPGDTVELLADGTEVFPGLIPNDDGGKSYTVDEMVPAGYRLTDIDCDGSSDDQDATNLDGIGKGAVVKVAAGEDVTCEFTNTKDATIEIAKVNVGGPEDEQFGFDASSDFGARSATYALDADDEWSMTGGQTQELSGVVPNAGHPGRDYSVEELVPAGYRLTSIECDGDNGSTDVSDAQGVDPEATIKVAAGEHVTCTYTNTKDSSITILKEAVGGEEGDSFDFSASDGLADAGRATADPMLVEGGFTLEDGQSQEFAGVVPNGDGAYTVTEDVPAGWRLTKIVCDDDDSTDESSKAGLEGHTATVELDAGEDVVCTFTNTRNATIKVTKVVEGGDDGDRFAFDASSAFGSSGTSIPLGAGETWSLGAGDTQTFANVQPNDYDGGPEYAVAETDAPDGYRLTSIDCSNEASTNVADADGLTDPATIVAAPGETVECTFTNTKDGTIEIEKQTDPDESDASAKVFTFAGSDQLAGNSDLDPKSFELIDDGVKTIGNVKPNDGGTAYEVGEAATIGYRLSGIDCGQDADSSGSAATRTASIHVSPGETVRCTFTNTKLNASALVLKEGTLRAHHGDPLTYTFDVTNTGNSPLHDVDVTDDRCSPVSDAPEKLGGDQDELLEQGEHWVFTCTYDAPAEHSAGEEDPIHNTATATALDEQDQPVSDTDVHDTDLLHPDIDVDKTVRMLDTGEFVDSGLRAHVGDTLEYRFTVTDGDSDTPIADVRFDDPRCDEGTIDGPVKSGGDADGMLEPGETWTYACTHVISTADGAEGSIENTATVTGEDELGGEVTDADTVVVGVITPSALVVKEGNQFAYPGDTVTFTFAVTNSGNTPLSDVAVTDDRCAPVTGPTAKLEGNQDGLLDPGEKWMFTCSKQIPIGHKIGDENPIRNIATATGKDPLGKTVESRDDHLVRVLHPAVDIEKTGPATALLGTALAYTLTVTNPGDVPFASQQVVVSDPRCEAPPAGPSTGADATPDRLDPGDVWTYTCTAQTAGQPAGTFVNRASVTARDFNGREVSDTDDFPTMLETQEVMAEIVNGSARLRGPSGCVSARFRATVRGSRIARVTFYRGGKRIKRIVAKPGQRKFTVKVEPARTQGVHRITAKVRFRSASQTRTRTLRLSYQRCRKQVVTPRFTG